jgi:hypothetical protein
MKQGMSPLYFKKKICLWSCASASSNPCQQVHSTVKRGMIDRIKPARLVQTVLDPDKIIRTSARMALDNPPSPKLNQVRKKATICFRAQTHRQTSRTMKSTANHAYLNIDMHEQAE